MSKVKELTILDYIEVHDRGGDRMAAKSGVALYSNDGLRKVDNQGNIAEVLNASTSSSVSPSFDTWTTADANRPTFIEVDASVVTDGTSEGKVVIDVDEDGGTSADYSLTIAEIDPDNASGAGQDGALTTYIPAGAQYQIQNVSDPNGSNVINTVREVTL